MESPEHLDPLARAANVANLARVVNAANVANLARVVNAANVVSRVFLDPLALPAHRVNLVRMDWTALKVSRVSPARKVHRVNLEKMGVMAP